jgi:hypothetical protein
MNNQVGASESFNAFVLAAENQSFNAPTAQSFCETEYIDETYEEDEYGCTSSPETLELLHGLSQKAREALQLEKAEQEEAEPAKARSRAENEASQRLRGKAELPRNQLPIDLTGHRFREKDLLPIIVRTMKAARKGVEKSPECVYTGGKRMLKEFQDDELLCNRLASLHFNSASTKLFCTGDVQATTLDHYSPYSLPLIWRRSHASHYPSFASFESKEQQGLHCRGVYLLVLCFSGRMWCYVGSGGSARGGILFRTVQHADPNWRAKNATLHLYRHLSQPGTRYRIYCLAEWPAIDGIPSQDETYDEIRPVEMLWQIRLATGAPGRMSPFFRDVQNNFDGGAPRATIYRGLNVDAALEKTRNYAGGGNRSFS